MLIHSTTAHKALNYSLEFSGGTSTTVTFNEDMDISQIDSEVTPVVEEVTGDKNVQPTKVVGTNQVTIKTRALNLDEREALNKALVDKFDVDESLIQAESISATVSNEMRRDASRCRYRCYYPHASLHLVPISRISALQAVQYLHCFMTFWLSLPSMRFPEFP